MNAWHCCTGAPCCQSPGRVVCPAMPKLRDATPSSLHSIARCRPDPVSADQLVQQAMTLLRQGAFADAVKLIVNAPASGRDTQAVQRTLAAAHAQAGDLLLAQEAIERALMMPPAEPATRALAGRIALDQHAPERAFPHFESLVEIAPAVVIPGKAAAKTFLMALGKAGVSHISLEKFQG